MEYYKLLLPKKEKIKNINIFCFLCSQHVVPPRAGWPPNFTLSQNSKHKFIDIYVILVYRANRANKSSAVSAVSAVD